MKKFILLTLILLLALSNSVFALHEPEIPAAPPKVTGSVSVSVMSDFVARGRKLGGEPAIQPSLTLNYEGFSFNFWQNNDTDDDWRGKGSGGHATESDITVTYFKSFDKLGVVVGALYIAGHGFADTTRWIAGLSYDTVLHPAITVYHDPDEGDGTFYVASISQPLPITEDISVNLSAQVSYDDGDAYAGVDKDGKTIHDFHYGQVSASTSFQPFKNMNVPALTNFFISPNINYSFPLSSKGEEVIENTSINGKSSILYGGVTAGVSF